MYCLYSGKLRASQRDVSLDFILCQYYHLLCNHDNGLRGESSVAMVEQVFKRRTEEIDDEDIV